MGVEKSNKGKDKAFLHDGFVLLSVSSPRDYGKLAPMTSCRQCQQENPDEANFCLQCGGSLSATGTADSAAEAPNPSPMPTEELLWRQFIGPNADRYLAQFRKFSSNDRPRFALSWNWPAFLFASFLWFLYRKMYLHAFVYAVGPMISTYMTGDFSSGLVWSVMAGATGNYLYYWHCREQLAEFKKTSWPDQASSEAAVKEAGGVQPYVVWVGVAMYVIFFVTLIQMIQESPPDSDTLPGRPVKPAAVERVLIPLEPVRL